MNPRISILRTRIQGLSEENRVLREEKLLLSKEMAYLKKALEESSRDDLTGLLRRNMFKEIVEEQLLILRRHPGKCLSIFVIDLNNLKTINDRYGHPAGDRVLITFAQLLCASLRDCDIIARGSAGGDEFLVLLPEQGVEGAGAAKLHLLKELEWQKKVILPAFFGAAIGVATTMFENASIPIKTFEDLYTEADQEMYKHKVLLKAQE